MNWGNLELTLAPTTIALAMLTAALLLAFARLARGPSLPDRVVALDLIAILSAGILAVQTIATGQSVFLDAAIVLALIAFLGTIAYARYLERRARGE
ncbi:MAG TPA: monovalent cation/H+ antiporter complex subunit F [Candidatus Eisenbacteria bacterium]|nr:monovalent cation/H+ antiporter complex subunit F [Candidatus Eisenbacteria bacterium]